MTHNKTPLPAGGAVEQHTTRMLKYFGKYVLNLKIGWQLSIFKVVSYVLDNTLTLPSWLGQERG